ncbi:hypothetical protein MMC25_004128 [Agyrium rufum]|nr:hypothetical protein [Agyrium rufum]
MAASSDLIDFFRLKVDFEPLDGVIIETKETSDRAKGLRQVRIVKRWLQIKRIGSGTFGIVWLYSVDDEPERKRAVKEIPKSRGTSLFLSNPNYQRELIALGKLSKVGDYEWRHLDVFVDFHGWYESERAIYLAMEYFELGDLSQYITHKMQEKDAQTIARQLLEGLDILHSQDWAHRDLKPQNIFIVNVDPWWVKLGDFGISKRLGENESRTAIGTLNYTAPEIIGYVDTGLDDESCEEDEEEERSAGPEKTPYTVAVDMWSLGVVLFELLAVRLPFLEQRRLANFCRGKVSLPMKVLHGRGVSEAGREFVRQLMAPQPSDRPSATVALQNAWIASTKEAQGPKKLLGREMSKRLKRLSSSLQVPAGGPSKPSTSKPMLSQEPPPPISSPQSGDPVRGVHSSNQQDALLSSTGGLIPESVQTGFKIECGIVSESINASDAAAIFIERKISSMSLRSPELSGSITSTTDIGTQSTGTSHSSITQATHDDVSKNVSHNTSDNDKAGLDEITHTTQPDPTTRVFSNEEQPQGIKGHGLKVRADNESVDILAKPTKQSALVLGKKPSVLRQAPRAPFPTPEPDTANTQLFRPNQTPFAGTASDPFDGSLTPSRPGVTSSAQQLRLPVQPGLSKPKSGQHAHVAPIPTESTEEWKDYLARLEAKAAFSLTLPPERSSTSVASSAPDAPRLTPFQPSGQDPVTEPRSKSPRSPGKSEEWITIKSLRGAWGSGFAEFVGEGRFYLADVEFLVDESNTGGLRARAKRDTAPPAFLKLCKGERIERLGVNECSDRLPQYDLINKMRKEGHKPRGIMLWSYFTSNKNELNIQKGQIVKDVQTTENVMLRGTDKDGNCGMLPENYVEILEEFPIKKKHRTPKQRIRSQLRTIPLGHIIPDTPPLTYPTNPWGLQAFALWDFESEEITDLGFAKGDVLSNLVMEYSNWWVASNRSGHRGDVPSNRIKVLSRPIEHLDADTALEIPPPRLLTVLDRQKLASARNVQAIARYDYLAGTGLVLNNVDITGFDLRFRRGELITKITMPTPHIWCGTGSSGKPGLFPHDSVELILTGPTDPLRDVPFVRYAIYEDGLQELCGSMRWLMYERDDTVAKMKELPYTDSGVMAYVCSSWTAESFHEITINAGDYLNDVITLTSFWWWGKNNANSTEGLFPSNQVFLLTSDVDFPDEETGRKNAAFAQWRSMYSEKESNLALTLFAGSPADVEYSVVQFQAALFREHAYQAWKDVPFAPRLLTGSPSLLDQAQLGSSGMASKPLDAPPAPPPYSSIANEHVLPPYPTSPILSNGETSRLSTIQGQANEPFPADRGPLNLVYDAPIVMLPSSPYGVWQGLYTYLPQSGNPSSGYYLFTFSASSPDCVLVARGIRSRDVRLNMEYSSAHGIFRYGFLTFIMPYFPIRNTNTGFGVSITTDQPVSTISLSLQYHTAESLPPPMHNLMKATITRRHQRPTGGNPGSGVTAGDGRPRPLAATPRLGGLFANGIPKLRGEKAA